MKFLENAPSYIFFTGKGGVGKTSIACASAVLLARSGKKVLIVSTDPASNIGQVFGVSIGHRTVLVPAVPGLSALEIDPREAAALYRERVIGPVRGKLPESVVNRISEQLSGACTTEIAAFDSFTELLVREQIRSEYDHVLFDTAPTGHTIRLLSLPGAWSRFLEEGKGDASCLGPLAGLERQRDQYRQAVATLSDPALTRLVLVARLQGSTLSEVTGTREELRRIGIDNLALVLNGVFPPEATEGDPLAEAIVLRERRALEELPENLRDLPRDMLPLRPENMVGLPALENLLEPLASGRPDIPQEPSSVPLPPLSALVDGIVSSGPALVMLMGKGGTGKTTLAAAIALAIAARGLPVHLTTTDPAAHLESTLSGTYPGLVVSRIDPRVETARYRDRVLESRGKSLDAEGRALLEEDLRSPCTEEVAVFQAFSRVVRESERSFVVVDTAPTGHTLLLLDAVGAYHSEVVRHMGRDEETVRTPLADLRNPWRSRVLIVTLGEPTPVMEAGELASELRRAGIEPWGWVVNASVAAARPTSSLLRSRARKEEAEIRKVLEGHAARVAVVPLLEREPVGVRELFGLLRKTGGLREEGREEDLFPEG
ncbi:MAG: arsenical pump-driving ATPase [Nitrospirae bacterium]|nr:arsenical pump-driving ATPase [Nitrospirota bacterium]